MTGKTLFFCKVCIAMFIVHFRYSFIRIALFWKVNTSLRCVFGGLRPETITPFELFHTESAMP